MLVWNTGSLGKKSKCPKKAGVDVGILSAKLRRVSFLLHAVRKLQTMLFVLRKIDLCLLKEWKLLFAR